MTTVIRITHDDTITANDIALFIGEAYDDIEVKIIHRPTEKESDEMIKDHFKNTEFGSEALKQIAYSDCAGILLKYFSKIFGEEQP